MAFLSEADVEALLLHLLSELGYATASDSDVGPDGKSPEREAYADVLLVGRLKAAIERLNPAIPPDARGDCSPQDAGDGKAVAHRREPTPAQLMVEGIDVEFRATTARSAATKSG